MQKIWRIRVIRPTLVVLTSLTNTGFDGPLKPQSLKEDWMDRRDFLTYSATGAVAAALLPALSVASSAATAPAPSSLTERGRVMPTRGRLVRADLPLNSPSQTMRYMTPQRFGMGGTQIGNIFALIDDVQAGLILRLLGGRV